MDLLFIFLYGFVSSAFFDKILEYLTFISAEFSKKAPELMRDYAASPSVYEVLASAQLGSAFGTLFLLIGLLVLSVYIVYSLFEGLSWKLSSEIAGEKISYYDYCKRFAIINIFWFVIFFIYQIAGFVNDFNKLAADRLGGGYTDFGVVLLVVFGIGLYFVTISYTVILRKKGLKQTFLSGFKSGKYILPRVLLIFAVLFVFDKILLLFSFNNTLMILFGIFVFMPFLTVMRVFAFNFMRGVKI